MKNPFHSLRAGILIQLVFLIVAAMLLINVAMLSLYERDLLKAREESGRIITHALNEIISLTVNKGNDIEALNRDMLFRKSIEDIISSGGFSYFTVVNSKGDVIFSMEEDRDKEVQALILTREVLSTRTYSVNYTGSTWGVLWLRSSRLFISSPLMVNNDHAGALTIGTSLIPVYELLRKSEKLILLYILLDSIILAIVGIYLLSRSVVKPIHRLLKMTEEYKDGEIIISPAEYSKDEIGNLTRSLGNMLGRLDDNKKELKEHISSLEKANEELGRAQSEIMRSEKLASVGRLAAGIAHEIGNPLGIILGYLELIKKEDIQEPEKKDFVERVESEITRINVIIRQLLDFSRPSSGKQRVSDVHDLIHNTLEILKPQSMMQGIDVTLSLKASEYRVMGNSNQLQQVFLNIIMNSADAMTEEERAEKCVEGVFRIESCNKGRFIELRFTDNGPGVKEEDINKIFDPFFTTKEPGLGTGLGLSVCYRIVEGMAGTIGAESIPGEGMTVIIRLPLYKADAEDNGIINDEEL